MNKDIIKEIKEKGIVKIENFLDIKDTNRLAQMIRFYSAPKGDPKSYFPTDFKKVYTRAPCRLFLGIVSDQTSHFSHTGNISTNHAKYKYLFSIIILSTPMKLRLILLLTVINHNNVHINGQINAQNTSYHPNRLLSV